MVLSWDEVEHVRLVDPFPSIEITYRFERVRQRETVRPNRANLVDPFAGLVRDFVAEVLRRRGDLGVDVGWDAVAAAPFEPVLVMPNEPIAVAGGAYRGTPRPAPHVAYRRPERLRERWRVVLWPSDGITRSVEGAFEHLLGHQPFPWSVRGSEAALTAEHLYVRTPRGVARVSLDNLRHRVDLPQLRLYVFGRRTVLALTERIACPVQEALDERLLPPLRLAKIG